MTQALAIGGMVSLLAWLYLLAGRSGFWRSDQRLPPADDLPGAPPVTVIIPARNEAECIAQALGSLLAQRYPGRLRIIVVDDGSTDGTGDVACSAAGGDHRVRIIRSLPLVPGWTGKLWAVHQGLQAANQLWTDSRYVLLTDADIAHGRDTLSRLVAKAEQSGSLLVSLMAHLRCQTFWERLLIPAFIYFFQKLYPFRRVNDPTDPVAGAAGGCMLVRADTLAEIGGVAAIRQSLIDDCALARKLKARGPIWLGFDRQTISLRPYTQLRQVWGMVARSAFSQLRNSAVLLLVMVIGMVTVYVVPVIAVGFGLIAGHPGPLIVGNTALLLMAIAFRPTVRLYELPAAWTLTLPLAAILYILMSIDSARRTWLGRGGEWKGRMFDADGAGVSR